MEKLDPGTILAKLRRDARLFSPERTSFSINPGIYAVFYMGSAFPKSCITVKAGDLIYVGKTESSQTSRDLNTHFANGRTGSSTLRRTLGALLRVPLNLKPQPRSESEQTDRRFRNYKFDAEGERRLTQWMRKNLGLAFFEMAATPKAEIKQIECALISLACPVLNLADNPANALGAAVRAERRNCSELARQSTGGSSVTNGSSAVSKPPRQPAPRHQSAMYLHDAISEVLGKRPGRTATAAEIADEIRSRNLYRKKTGAFAASSQVLLRAGKRPGLFEILSSQRIRLR